MCGVVRMSCVMRFSARCSIDYIYSIDYIQMSMELTKKKKKRIMFGEHQLSCAMRSSACDYTHCAHK